MFASYCIQLGICMLIFTIVFLRMLLPFYYRIASVVWSKPSSSDSETQQGYEEAFASEKPHEYKNLVIESVIEFQKAQVYFGTSIQIASLAQVKDFGLAARSLQIVLTNLVFLTLVAQCGAIPVVWILLILRTLKHKSWGLLVLSSISSALSLVAFLVLNTHYKDGYSPDGQEWYSRKYLTSSLFTSGEVRYHGCEDVNPVSLCLPKTSSGSFLIDYVNVFYGILFSLAVAFILFLDMCRGFKAVKVMESWPWIVRLRNLRGLGAIQFFLLWGVHGGFLMFVVYSAKSLYYFIHAKTQSKLSGVIETENLLDVSNWTFGQVVSVTIWVPPFAQFIYLLLRE